MQTFVKFFHLPVFREITDTLPESQVLFTTAQQSLVKTLAANRTTSSLTDAVIK